MSADGCLTEILVEENKRPSWDNAVGFVNYLSSSHATAWSFLAVMAQDIQVTRGWFRVGRSLE